MERLLWVAQYRTRHHPDVLRLRARFLRTVRHDLAQAEALEQAADRLAGTADGQLSLETFFPPLFRPTVPTIVVCGDVVLPPAGISVA